MQTKEAEINAVPPGYIQIKKGGRPRKGARDAAVFLAKYWRMEMHGETATKAEQWVCDTWEKAGTKASKGISETAHVRSAIKRARLNGLAQSLLIFDPSTGICTAVEGEKINDIPTVKDGARSWHWSSGMEQAVDGKVGEIEETRMNYGFCKSPIATAVGVFLHGLS